MSRLFKGYASNYAAKQVQTRRVRRFQKRTVTADFNGAIPANGLIDEVVWECTSPWATYMENPAISTDQKSVTVDVSFNYGGWGWIKATAILESGEQLNYEFTFDVTDAPMYPSTTYLNNTGPFSVTAIAP